jgi:hypothetical protein
MKLPFTIYDLRFTICQKPGEAGSSITAGADGGTRAAVNRKSSIVNHQSRGGFALVITLILLSVTLIMAVAFLAISRRERGAVTTTTDSATARYAADAALANAEAQIMSTVLATTNPYINNLLVSTNYINRLGFDSTAATPNPTNVNYDKLANGGGYTVGDFLQNVANLQFLPRVPVYVPTNNLGSNDFRFYLDLNRNGNFEDSGPQPQLDSAGLFIHSDGTADSSNPVNVLTNFMVGDPQWIGVLERPDAPHGPNNKFLARYAFIALPADNALDLNYIHNEAMSQTANPVANGQDSYFRNQGVGSWEINLAAFLTDLNTNEWNTLAAPYNYQEWMQPPFANTGFAFQDALSLVSYRYGFTYNSLAPVGGPGGPNLLRGLFTSLTIFAPFQNNIDYYSRGGLMTTLGGSNYFPNILVPWAGADNTNHYFALTSDLFDPAKVEYNVTAPGFIERLNQAGTNNSTYDRYTFYRMLSQLGTDSSPESGKMNLNYDNLDPFRFNLPLHRMLFTPNGVVSATNFAAWTPLAFFTNAADRMLRLYTTNWFQAGPSNYLATYYGLVNFQYTYTNPVTGAVLTNDPSGIGLTNALGLPNVLGLTQDGIPAFSLTNIPVSINGRYVYSSAIQRVLQLAANIYDASTNSFYPSRFRPVFTATNVLTSAGIRITNVYVSGFVQQVNSFPNNSLGQELSFLGNPAAFDIAPPVDASTLPQGMNMLTNVYGVPWIIGAKKGFPNFNEFSMENSIQVSRTLNVTRNTNTVPASNYATNQMYSMAITNYFGLECWNSYFNQSNYTGLTGRSGKIVIAVRNLASMTLTNYSPYANPYANAQTILTTNWLVYTLDSWPSNLFVVPLNTNAAFFTYTNPVFVYKYNQFGSPSNYLDSGIFPMPQFGFVVTNRLQVAIIDYSDPALGGQIVDYVQLGPLTGNPRNINAEMVNAETLAGLSYYNGLWSTNLFGSAPSTVPYGVVNQIHTSAYGGTISAADGGRWSTVPVPGLPPNIASSQQAEQLYFKAFFSGNDTANNGVISVVNVSPSMQAPYTPVSLKVQRLSWQANDPLVHYLASDLYDPAGGTNSSIVDWPANLGYLNDRYQPWGGNPINPPNLASKDDPKLLSATNMALKDPLVSSSARWDFPTNKFPTVGWLGRVHRGTPWQTVYLKASNIVKTSGTNIWQTWTGNNNAADAMNEGPVQDRLLFDIFTTALNDNASRGQLSVNVAASTNADSGLAAWSALLSGIAVPTNLVGGFTTIPPAGAAGIYSPMGDLVTNINNQRTLFTNTTGSVGAFKHVGDILSVRALSEQSPFLTPYFNSTLPNQMNDEVYEWLPQQTLSLLRADDNPRYVIYCYGQTLQPAPNGVVTSGGPNVFGMVTNYQVVAETATRAVVQFHPVVVTDSVTGLIQTNFSATLEQFNPLPPD